MPESLRDRPYALAVFVGCVLLTATTATYGVGSSLLDSTGHAAVVLAADAVVAAAAAIGAILVATGSVASRRGLELVAVGLLCSTDVTVFVEMFLTPSRITILTSHCSLVLLAACVVVRSPRALTSLLVAAPVSWVVVVHAASEDFDQVAWLPTWLLTLATCGTIIALTRTERDARRGLFRQVESEALFDPLTGLLNRRGFEAQAHEMWALCRRLEQPVWCAFVDVDRFKKVNDELGHSVGDDVLVAVASAVRATARNTDLAARWGGDEFVLLGIGREPVESELELRITSGITVLDAKAAQQWVPAVSVGVAGSSTAAPACVGSLIESADARMYAHRSVRRHVHR